MIVSLIVAVAENLGIGKNNDLLWHLPKDMKFFKETTSNHHILTGRKNYLSIPKKFRPLPNRVNIVLTRDLNFNEPNCIIKHNLDDAINFAKENNEQELFIIGGGEIYKQAIALNLVDKMYITHVHTRLEADTFFPKIDLEKWHITCEQFVEKDEKNKYDLTFTTYEKK